ncbi:MAG: serine/threonine protein kinase, partial [Ktedonobacteraceae bacterium]|nr:serine/threonine protein kinase [Ktedonobacteraceae bacterium]
MPGLEGTTLGHHRLKRLIGRGGMATVYLGVDEHLRREVAIKVVHQGHDEHFQRFQREAETIGPLTHEHILPVFEYGQQGPWHYLVMPYMRHGTLDDRLRKSGPLGQREAGLILEQIASALQFAHDRGILHRDIKPSNILLRDDSYAYLADFGIAKAQQQESHLTQTGFFMGTPGYIAPEVADEPASPRSDTYALGVVLYQMLTGRLPFQGDTPTATLLKQMQEAPPRPSSLNPAIPPALDAVVLRALERDPRRRFQKPQALATAYKQAIEEGHSQRIHLTPASSSWADERTEQVPLPPKPVAARPSRSRPLMLAAGGGLMLLILLFWSIMQFASQSKNPMVQTPTTHANASVQPSPTISPSVTADACSGQVSLQDKAQILTRDKVCTAAKTLPYKVTIYTTKASAKGKPGGDDIAQSLVTSPQMIVIVIQLDSAKPGHGDSTPRAHISIAGGDAVSISDSQYHDALDAFNQVVDEGGDYTE